MLKNIFPKNVQKKAKNHYRQFSLVINNHARRKLPNSKKSFKKHTQ